MGQESDGPCCGSRVVQTHQKLLPLVVSGSLKEKAYRSAGAGAVTSGKYDITDFDALVG